MDNSLVGKRKGPFNPNDQRYYHAFCCGAHVTKAASSVAFASLILIFLRSIILILARIRGNQFRVATADALFSIGLTTLIEFVCCLILIYAVLDEVRLFVVPYLIHQVYSTALMLHQYCAAMAVKEKERGDECARSITEFCATYYIASDTLESAHFNSDDRETYAKMFVVLVQICKVAVTFCFCKVIFNYFMFIKNNDSPRNYGEDGEYVIQYEEEKLDANSYEPITGDDWKFERFA